MRHNEHLETDSPRGTDHCSYSRDRSAEVCGGGPDAALVHSDSSIATSNAFRNRDFCRLVTNGKALGLVVQSRLRGHLAPTSAPCITDRLYFLFGGKDGLATFGFFLGTAN